MHNNDIISIILIYSTLSPDALCKACCFKKKSDDSNQYVPAEWKESSSGRAYQPSTNFSPTFYGPVMISKKLIDPSSASQDRVIEPMMWGMIPPWHTVNIINYII